MDLEGTIRSVVEQGAGLELVDVAFHRGSGRSLLRVTIDRQGGVDLDAIAETSERISRRLDLEGFNPGPYSLEVGSPGIERPLKQPRDFVRWVGHRIKVKTSSPVDGGRSLTGTLVAADPEGISLATEHGEQVLSYEQITSA